MLGTGMASKHMRHPRNATGDFYVDTSCIDCGTCSRLAPGTFGHDDMSPNAYVQEQPGDCEARLEALRALVSCPTGSIHTEVPADLTEAIATLPLERAPGVYDCGFASQESYGACGWLLVRPEGNVLVDSPRASPEIMDRIEALGGVATMFLTHREDVGDHEAFVQRFGCERVMHERDAFFEVERLIEGDEPFELASDLVAVPVPGHTRGSMALLAQDRYLFTGDHVWGDALGRLAASRCLCWWSWPDQQASLRKLRQHRFTWVLPGHGYPFQAANASAMRFALDDLIERMGG